MEDPVKLDSCEGDGLEYRKLGRFNIEKTLARGGMGEVVRSTDDSGLPIALKTILDDFQGDRKFQEMFVREAEITFKLDHPNIVKAYRFEQIGNRLVLALEYLDGISVKDILRKIYDRKLHMPVVIAIAILQRVLRGMEYAHNKKDEDGRALGIVHRDLNPSNIFVTWTGDVKILDFGISKATQKEVHQLTPKNELRGKICYLSPEQVQEKEVDRRADIFCLGILLWEMLAGRPLFLRASDAEAMEAITHGDYTALSTLRSDVHAGLEQVIRTCLQGDPNKRYADCRELEKAIQRAMRGYYIPGVGEEEISVYARSMFSKVEDGQDPHFLAAYGFLMTQVPGKEQKGLEVCTQVATRYVTSPFIQLNYARAQYLMGNRLEGFRALRRLSRVDSLENQIQEVLEWIGVRRSPVLGNLKRGHILNHSLGWIRHRVLGPTPSQQEFLAA